MRRKLFEVAKPLRQLLSFSYSFRNVRGWLRRSPAVRMFVALERITITPGSEERGKLTGISL